MYLSMRMIDGMEVKQWQCLLSVEKRIFLSMLHLLFKNLQCSKKKDEKKHINKLYLKSKIK